MMLEMKIAGWGLFASLKSVLDSLYWFIWREIRFKALTGDYSIMLSINIDLLI